MFTNSCCKLYPKSCQVLILHVTHSNKRLLSTAKHKIQIEKWEPVIGLEIHAQISSASKLFSGAGTSFSAPVNSQVAALDAAMPGTLPVINKCCVEAGVTTALALKSNINYKSWFDRKHYFYADLPAGYQITQQRQPLATDGQLTFVYQTQVEKKMVAVERTARLTQIQLEQDSGKSLHDDQAGCSLIDLNRAGVGLMEIITYPEFHSAEEAAAFVRELHRLLVAIGTCDGKMSEGSLRVDASVSLRRPGGALGVRAEVKNLNSVRFVRKAIEYEIERQTDILNRGGVVENQTRQFSIESGETYALRDKEKVHDYRFMPEPNLPPLTLYTDDDLPSHLPANQVVNVDELRRRLPVLPEDERRTLVSDYDITLGDAAILVNEPGLADAFRDIMKVSQRNVHTVINILKHDLLGVLYTMDITLPECEVTHEHIGDVIDMVQDRRLSTESMNKVFSALLAGYPHHPAQLVEENNWYQITDVELLTQICRKVIEENPQTVEKYKLGKKKVFNHLVGQVQRETERRADVAVCSQILTQLLHDMT